MLSASMRREQASYPRTIVQLAIEIKMIINCYARSGSVLSRSEVECTRYIPSGTNPLTPVTCGDSFSIHGARSVVIDKRCITS
jgi:hypothetical protein